MNAYVTKEELALLPAERISYPEHYADARGDRHGDVIGGVFSRIAAYFQRQRVLSDLKDLTDRELADIGLTRSELHLVFQPAFIRRR